MKKKLELLIDQFSDYMEDKSSSRFFSEEEDSIKETFEALKANKSIAKEIYEGDICDLAKYFYEQRGIDYRSITSTLYPYDYESQIYNDKKEVLQALLQSDKLDIYQLNVCFNIDKGITISILQQDKNILKNVENLFDDNESFYMQEEISQKGFLRDVIDVEQKIAATRERIQELSGKEVFKILTKRLEDIPEYQKANLLQKVWMDYNKQLDELSPEDEGTDVNYWANYGSRGLCWKERENFLDIVGTFEDPKVEQEIQKRLARLYEYFAYPPRPYRNEEQKVARTEGFHYTSAKGGDMYIAKMKEALLDDSKSIKSQFFVQNLPDLLSSFNRCGDFGFSDMLQEIAPQLIEQNQPLLEYLWQYKKSRNKTEGMIEQIIADPDSKISQFYLKQAKDFSENMIRDKMISLFEKYKDTRPDICESIVKGIVEGWSKDIEHHAYLSSDPMTIKLYSLYPTKEMAEVITKKAKCKAFDFQACAECLENIGSNSDGMEEYKSILENNMENSIKSYIKDGRALEIELKDGYTYKRLFAKMGEVQAEKLSVKNVSEDFNVEGLLQISTLKKLHLKGNKVEHPEKLIEGLSNLEFLNLDTEVNDNKLIYETLMKHKPDNFEYLCCSMSEEMADELMQKYPDLIIKDRTVMGGSFQLRQRNEKVIKAKHAKNPLETAVEEAVLVEYLQALPKDKRPKMADLINIEGYDIFEKIANSDDYDYDDYYKILKSVSQVIGDKEMERKVDLLVAVEQGKAVEYLESLQPKDRPKLEEFYEPSRMLRDSYLMDDKTILYQIGENLDEDKRIKLIGTVLTLLQVDEKDIAKLISKGDSVSKAVKIWHEQQSMTKASQASLNAFKEWQARQAKQAKDSN